MKQEKYMRYKHYRCLEADMAMAANNIRETVKGCKQRGVSVCCGPLRGVTYYQKLQI